MRYGYIYKGQMHTDLDEEHLAPYLIEELFVDERGYDRPALKEVLSKLSEGDVLFVPRFSHLGRTYKQMILLAGEMKQKGAKIYAAHEKADMTIFLILGETDKAHLFNKNPNILSPKVVYGKRGRVMGRKPIDDEVKMKALEMYAEGRPLREIRSVTGLSNTTIYKTIRKYQASLDLAHDGERYNGEIEPSEGGHS